VKNNTKRGLGRGLDSLIPNIDEDIDEKSSLTEENTTKNEKENDSGEELELEEKKKKEEKENNNKKVDASKNKLSAEDLKEINDELAKKEENIEIMAEEIIEEKGIGETLAKREEIAGKNVGENVKEIKTETVKTSLNDYEVNAIEEVKNIIAENPRITLWSAKSSAVFRYLRKTRPEFSISKEASELVDEAVREKYPEIWELFDDI